MEPDAKGLDPETIDKLRRRLESNREELEEEMIREDVEWGLRGDDPQPRRGDSA
jgi:hypothetical protein